MKKWVGNRETDQEMTFDDLVEMGISGVLSALGKGQNLHDAISTVVRVSIMWSEERAKNND